MAFVSMINREEFKKGGWGNYDNDIRVSVNKQKSGGERMVFNFGNNIVENIGWITKDRVVIKWDPETKEGIIRRATLEEKQLSLSLSKGGSGKRLRTTFKWRQGFPRPDKPVSLEGVEINNHEIFFDFPLSCFTYLIKERAELLKQNNEI